MQRQQQQQPSDIHRLLSPAQQPSVAVLLQQAKQLQEQARLRESFELLITALQLLGGESLVSRTLQHAREQFLAGQQQQQQPYASSPNQLEAGGDEVDELTRAFEQTLSLAASQMSNFTTNQQLPSTSSMSAPDIDASGSILAETGRTNILHDAAADVTSFVCERCGGVVSSARREAHATLWCNSI
eukprot:jgi/Chlat1/8387/Chrsp80S07822